MLRNLGYSDETSKLFDKSNNWIHFNTDYETNAFTGESSNKPIAASSYIDKGFLKNIIDGSVKDNAGYSIELKSDGVVAINSPLGVTCISESKTGMPFSVFLQVLTNKKKSKAFIEKISQQGGVMTSKNTEDGSYIQITMPSGNAWYFDVSSVVNNKKISDDEISGMRDRIKHSIYKIDSYGMYSVREDEPYYVYVFSNERDEISYMLHRIFFAKTNIKSCLSYYSDLNELVGSNYSVKGIDGNGLSKKDNMKYRKVDGSNVKGGYYDERNNRMYYPDEERVMQLFSNSANEVSEGQVLVNCLPTDTIVKFRDNDNFGEIYFSNGDYLKYSKLQKGLVYDCYLHRKDGVLSVTNENNKCSSKYVFTEGEFKDFVYEKVGSFYYDDVLSEYNIFSQEDHSNIFSERLDKEYDEERSKQADEVAIFTVVSSEVIEAQAKEQKQKAMQELYRKYGKKYVDAVFNNNKILIGTPEGLIANNLNSTLKVENQATRVYEITGVFGGRAATVIVDKKSKTVSSISYR